MGKKKKGKVRDEEEVGELCGHLSTSLSIGHPHCGIRNAGNTCYMNSVLQCAVFSLPLSELSTSSRRPLVRSLVSLGRELQSTSSGSVSASSVKSAMARKYRRFAGYGQEDAHEFLRSLLDSLHDELNEGNPKLRIEEIEQKRGESVESVANRYWDFDKKRNESVIRDVFCGQLRSCLQCLSCNNVSSAFDPFLDLSVPVSRRSESLDDCLNTFFDTEKLVKSEKPRCEKCGCKRESTKHFTIFRLPQCLVIHLKRFRVQSIRSSKITSWIDFPRELDMREYVDEETSAHSYIYDLYAVVHHSGSVDFGHYTSCIDDGSGKWWTYNDSHVSRCREGVIGGPSAYILFYKQR